MTATASANNVIEFPLERAGAIPPRPPEDMMKDMADRRRAFVDKIVEDIGNEVYAKILFHGFPAKTQPFIARYSYVLESLRSCLYWTIEEEHPFSHHIQDIINQFHEDISDLFEEEDNPDPTG
jgi:hypothetical protein